MSSPPLTSRPPKVIFWYNVYRSFLLLVFLSAAGAGVALALYPEEILDNLVGGGLYFSAGGLAALLTAISFFLPRSRTAYAYHILVMTLGTVTGLFCLVLDLLCIGAMIVLLIFWVRPEVQAYFGWSTELDGLTRKPRT